VISKATPERRCANCVYYDPTEDTPGQGVCRRYPPNDYIWAFVADDDWCGEFAAK
jgi:hypothetical protein